MEILSILVLILGLILCFGAQYRIKHTLKEDNETKLKNEKILQEYNSLLEKQNNLIKKLNLLNEQEQQQTEKLKTLNEMTSNFNKTAAAAFEQYIDALEAAYKQKEQDFETNVQLLDDSYAIVQKGWIQEQEQILQDLDKIKQTRAAAIQAQLKEEEIKQKQEYYSLHLSPLEFKDVKILRDIEYKLNNPRVLRMLIWQTFYREPMNQLCNNIIGPTIKSGIYKITNQSNGTCYIGQAVDLAKRWKDHAKCGLGIDAPANNLLYKSMQENGLENFTWEVLEFCSSTELNKKEKFYIELYQSKEYGMNKTGGNK